jgi:hypothetical protein
MKKMEADNDGKRDLHIDPMAYGTRWYLTLFNLSIPFPAQLRVWDVFLLLGDSLPEPPATSGGEGPPSSSAAVPGGGAPSSDSAPSGGGGISEGSPGGLDIIHAASTALVLALREVLLESDFENAMKALTSWIPVKNEELLMKVTKAEYKAHRMKG